ncbi:MAG TPA: hypothetical protein VNM92_14210 [Thermoanaerobaculia bacterium]|nr:hypothetical protein [Thermoanaerobaculia bacterium]
MNGAPYTFSVDVIVRKGPGLISIGVVDLVTKEAGYLVRKTGV